MGIIDQSTGCNLPDELNHSLFTKLQLKLQMQRHVMYNARCQMYICDPAFVHWKLWEKCKIDVLMEGQWFDTACYIGDNTVLSPFSALETRGKEERAKCEDILLLATWTARPRFIELKTSITKEDSAHLSCQISRTETKKIRFDKLKNNKVGDVSIH